MSSPDIISRGFVYMKESEELIAGARTLARKIQAHYAGQKQIDWDALKKDLRDQISNYLVDQTQRRPMVISAVISV
jgi:ribonuclease J